MPDETNGCDDPGLRQDVRDLVQRLGRVCEELERSGSAARRARRETERTGETPSKTVMVVEDNEDARDILVTVLEHAGYATIAAGNGAEALAKLKQVVPSAILLDIRMPEMDGFALRKAMQDEPTLRRVPVIAVSAFVSFDGVRQALDADAYFQKPVDLEGLIQALPALLA